MNVRLVPIPPGRRQELVLTRPVHDHRRHKVGDENWAIPVFERKAQTSSETPSTELKIQNLIGALYGALRSAQLSFHRASPSIRSRKVTPYERKFWGIPLQASELGLRWR